VDIDLAQIDFLLKGLLTFDEQCQHATVSSKDMAQHTFSLGSLEEVKSIFVFFVGWIKSANKSFQRQDVVFSTLCNLLEDASPIILAQVAPTKRLNGYFDSTQHKLPHTTLEYSEIQEPWLRALSNCAEENDATRFKAISDAAKNVAVTVLNIGGYEEAFHVSSQVFVAECLVQESWPRESHQELRKLAAWCDAADRGGFTAILGYKTAYKTEETDDLTYSEESNQGLDVDSDEDSCYSKAWKIGRKRPKSARLSNIETICQFFDSLDSSIFQPEDTVLLYTILNLFKRQFSPNCSPSLFKCRLQRALARKFSGEGDFARAEQYLRQALLDFDHCNSNEVPRTENGTPLMPLFNEAQGYKIQLTLQLDLALLLRISRPSVESDEAASLGQSSLRGFVYLARSGKADWGEVLTCRDHLVTGGLTHWKFDRVAKAPFRIKGTLGAGGYSIVNSITWEANDEMEYAQKIYRIPTRGSNQALYTATIQSEIAAIRKLDPEPHIVRIEYTYTELQTFVVVLSPRADEDLQSYLERQSAVLECQRDPDCDCDKHIATYKALTRYREIFSKWFCCLATSLARIHCQGVRHKDIKSRNILLKDQTVLYADFGSSKIFESELTSSTTGTVKSGNTPMYSAPEVMKEQKRSRSADIFSLGCVFTEMLTVKRGRKLGDYHEFRKTKFKDEWGASYETCHYYKTLDRIDAWFELYPDCSQEYETLIRPMLDVDRLKRPTALAVAAAFRDFYHDSASACQFCGRSPDLLSIFNMLI